MNHRLDTNTGSIPAVVYKSYVGGNDGEQYGKPTTITAFYSASADGTLTYPINHWINFHRPKNQLHKLFYGKNNLPVTIKEINGSETTDFHTGLGQFDNEFDTEAKTMVSRSSYVAQKTVDGTDVVSLKVNRLKDKRK